MRLTRAMLQPSMNKPPSLFSQLPVRADLQKVLAELGFETATSIQTEAIPVLLSGKDFVGQSKTGSGKTLAFSIPLVQRLENVRRTQALVLCPTRELCTQVTREIRKIGRRFAGLNVVPLVGGQPTAPQIAALKKGAHVAVGTPGRVLDLLRREALPLQHISYLVLDEADRMLDMGFEEDMLQILDGLPEERQTVFFSATFPESIEEMSKRFQKKPVRVTIESEPEAQAKIEQAVLAVEEEDKLLGLLSTLEKHQPESAIVFCNLKNTVAELNDALEEAGVSTAALSGDLTQEARDRVMAQFRNRSIRVLVATDVAARGIDVADLDLVVNFDLPKPDVYVHRIGRTGRAGKSGRAVSFAGKEDSYKVREIEKSTGVPMRREAFDASTERRSPTPAADAAMVTLYIGGGRKDKVRPGDILGALTGEGAGLAGSEVGKIEILDRFSYVAVAKHVAKTALIRLQTGKIKGRKFRVELVK
jgi:ATP-independent RNA helicase DbpA